MSTYKRMWRLETRRYIWEKEGGDQRQVYMYNRKTGRYKTGR
jgi:hypothetical protein